MLLDFLGAFVAMLSVSLAPSPAVAADRLKPVSMDHDHYAETFTFVADLDGGTYAQVQLSVTNLGPGSGHGICRALVAKTGEKAWSDGERVGEGKWRHNASGPDEMLQVGPCRVRSTPQGVQVSAALADRQLRLEYPRLAAAEKPPKHELKVAGGVHVTEILVPGAKVSASLQRRGERPVRLAGNGYADHSLSTIEPRALAKSWVRFRALRGDAHVLVLGREALDGSFGPLWMRGKGGAYAELERFAVARGGDKNEPSFVATIAGAKHLELTTGELLYRYAPVEELGLLASVVKPFAGSPVTYTYRATMKGADSEPIPGILEISLASE